METKPLLIGGRWRTTANLQDVRYAMLDMTEERIIVLDPTH